MEIKFTPEQEEILAQVYNPLPKYMKRLDIKGYAGTGKSTIMADIAKQRPYWFFLALTNKAVEVLRDKGIEHAQTIFSFLHVFRGISNEYDENYFEFLKGSLGQKKELEDKILIRNKMQNLLEKNKNTRFSNVYDEGELEGVTIVVDEWSMVDEKTEAALIATGARIISLGDAGQLPPVQGRSASKDGDEDFLLTQVHRQKGESFVLDIATQLREKQSTTFIYTKSCPYIGRPYSVKMGMKQLLQTMKDYDQTVVFRLRTVAELNQFYRQKILGHPENKICKGEKIMVMANNKREEVYKAQSLIVENDAKISSPFFITVKDARTGNIAFKEFSLQNLDINEPLSEEEPDKDHVLADYSYAITCHKSQGSSWPKVLVVLEGRETWRWLYTAVTRAIDDVLIVRLDRTLD